MMRLTIVKTLAESRPGEIHQVAGVQDGSRLREWFERIGIQAGGAVTTQAAVHVITAPPGAAPAAVGDYLRIGVAKHTVDLTLEEARQIELTD